MYPPSFEYHRPETVEEALELLEEHADQDAELLAGGHSLLPTMKSGLASPDVLIDIGEVADLDDLAVDEGMVRIGALTTYDSIVRSDEVSAACPVLTEAAGEIGDVQVRNRGTIGGNLAHSDPASDLPAAAIVSEATIHVRGPDGERAIDAEDFFLAMYTTTLGEDEILTRVDVPALEEGGAGAYVKKPSPSSGYAIVGVAVRLHTDGDTIERARVAANGALDHARRLAPVEEELADASIDAPDLATDAASRATEDLESWELMDDLQTSSEFRSQLLEVYAERALETALERVEDGS